MNAQFIISNIAIHQDSEQRYSLNDLHKASGGEQRHEPNKWMRLEQTREFINEIINAQIWAFSPVTSRRGCKGGTYVCRELVYSYAMWISAKFHLTVIRTYDALVTAKPAPKTTTNERTPLRDAINMLVGKKGIMYPEAYSLIHQRFNVEHIDELPAAQIPQAIEYVHKLVLEGELLEREKPQQQIGLMPLEIDRDGEWVVKVKDGRPVSYSLIGKGEMVLSKESFQELMERAGYLIIHYTELRVMAALDSVMLSDKAEKHHEHWKRIHSIPL